MQRVGDYTYNDQGIYFDGKDGIEKVTNFMLVLFKEIIVYSLDEKPRRYVELGLWLHGRLLDPVVVEATELLSERWLAKNFTMAIWYENYSHVRNMVRMIAGNIITIHQYNYTGWIKERPWVYVHSKGVIGSDKMLCNITTTEEKALFSLPEPKIGQKKALDYVINNLFQIRKDGLPVALCMFNLLSLVTSKFSDPAPHFFLLLYGKTGSYKTLISKLIFNFFEGLRDRTPMNFSVTTSASKDYIGVEYKDCVCIYDDIAPSSDPTQRRQNEQKLDMVARTTGD